MLSRARLPTQTVSTQPQPGLDESIQSFVLGDQPDQQEIVRLIAPNPEALESEHRRITDYRTFMINFFAGDKYTMPPQVTTEMAVQFIATLCAAIKKYLAEKNIVKDINNKPIDESIYSPASYFYRIDTEKVGTMILHTPASLIPGMLLLGNKDPVIVVRNSLYPVPLPSINESYYYVPDSTHIIPSLVSLPMMDRHGKNQNFCVCGGRQMFEIATSPILNGFQMNEIELKAMAKSFKAGCSGCISLQRNDRSDIQNMVQSRITAGTDTANYHGPFMDHLMLRKVARSGAVAETRYEYTVDPVFTRVMTEPKYRPRGHILVSSGFSTFYTALNIPTIANAVTARKNKEKTSPTSGGDLKRDEAELTSQLHHFVTDTLDGIARRIVGAPISGVTISDDIITIQTNIKRIYDSVFLQYIFRAYTVDLKAVLEDYASKYIIEPELKQAIAMSRTPFTIRCQRQL